MINTHQLLEGMDYKSDFDPAVVEWHDEWQFIHLPGQAPTGAIRFVGFATPYLPGGDFPVPNTVIDVVRPVTVYRDLPASLQAVDHTSKCVGTRVYSTQEAARAGSDLPGKFIGAYILDLFPDKIFDRRPTQGGTMKQIARHALQRVGERIVGAEQVTERIHKRYGEADAVVWNVPPRGKRAQNKGGEPDPEGVTSAFMVLRNPDLRLIKVGRNAISGIER